jgi:hypothetical protein
MPHLTVWSVARFSAEIAGFYPAWQTDTIARAATILTVVFATPLALTGME